MIFDFKKNRIIFVIGLILTLLAAVILLQFDANPENIFIASAIAALIIWVVLRKTTVHEMQQLQIKFMLHCDPKAFKEAYIKLLTKGFSYDKRWTITKHQNAILGSIFSGDQETSKYYLEILESRHSQTLEKQPIYRYSHAVTQALYAVFYEDKDAIFKRLEALKHAFEKLPATAKKTIERNINGFHYWFELVEAHILSDTIDTETFVEKLIELSPFFQISGHYLLKRFNLETHQAKLIPLEHQMFQEYVMSPLFKNTDK